MGLFNPKVVGSIPTGGMGKVLGGRRQLEHTRLAVPG